MKVIWKDNGFFWEHNAPQGSDDWKEVRKGRTNSSNSGAMGEKSNFQTAEETGEIIAGVKESVFSEKSIEAMAHGTKFEGPGRDWYEKKYKCKVLERGLCVPKHDITIGASVDGDIVGTGGILEIKCPSSMYYPILNYLENIKNGWKPPQGYHEHIWKTHFCQMQHGMYVLNKQWCDYIVYCTSTSQIFTQRINFDSEFWEQHYSIIKKNYKLYVQPNISGTSYPISP